MCRQLSLIVLAIVVEALVAGCGRSTPPSVTALKPKLLWVGEGISHEGMQISLGYRGAAAADHSVEPIASIAHSGKPVAGAMVFISLVAKGDKSTKGQGIAAEVATVYEPADEKTTTLYTPGKLQLPDGQSPWAMRFRIVLPGSSGDFIREIPLPSE